MEFRFTELTKLIYENIPHVINDSDNMRWKDTTLSVIQDSHLLKQLLFDCLTDNSTSVNGKLNHIVMHVDWDKYFNCTMSPIAFLSSKSNFNEDLTVEFGTLNSRYDLIFNTNFSKRLETGISIELRPNKKSAEWFKNTPEVEIKYEGITEYNFVQTVLFPFVQSFLNEINRIKYVLSILLTPIEIKGLNFVAEHRSIKNFLITEDMVESFIYKLDKVGIYSQRHLHVKKSTPAEEVKHTLSFNTTCGNLVLNNTMEATSKVTEELMLGTFANYYSGHLILHSHIQKDEDIIHLRINLKLCRGVVMHKSFEVSKPYSKEFNVCGYSWYFDSVTEQEFYKIIKENKND